MNLLLTEEQQMIQETAKRFAESKLAPVAAAIDKGEDREGFLARIRQLAEMGCMGLNVSAHYG